MSRRRPWKMPECNARIGSPVRAGGPYSRRRCHQPLRDPSAAFSPGSFAGLSWEPPFPGSAGAREDLAVAATAGTREGLAVAATAVPASRPEGSGAAAPGAGPAGAFAASVRPSRLRRRDLVLPGGFARSAAFVSPAARAAGANLWRRRVGFFLGASRCEGPPAVWSAGVSVTASSAASASVPDALAAPASPVAAADSPVEPNTATSSERFHAPVHTPALPAVRSSPLHIPISELAHRSPRCTSLRYPIKHPPLECFMRLLSGGLLLHRQGPPLSRRFLV